MTAWVYGGGAFGSGFENPPLRLWLLKILITTTRKFYLKSFVFSQKIHKSKAFYIDNKVFFSHFYQILKQIWL